MAQSPDNRNSDLTSDRVDAMCDRLEAQITRTLWWGTVIQVVGLVAVMLLFELLFGLPV